MLIGTLMLGAVLNVPEIVIREPIPPCIKSLRINRDIPVNLNLSKAKVVSFDMICKDLRPFANFTIYLRYGEMSISHSFVPTQPAGTLEHFDIPIEEFGVGKFKLKDVGSLAKVSQIRFSGWRNSAEDGFADIIVKNFEVSEEPLPVRPEVEDKLVEPLPVKLGERRRICCHRAWGIDKKPGKTSWDEQIERLKAAGFSDIAVHMAWAGKAYYKSAVYSEDPVVAKYGDMLESCKAACHRHGIKFWAWKCCWNMGKNADSELRRRLAVEGRLQMNFKDVASGVPSTNWLCPTDPENVRMETAAMVELAKRGVDGIHFDYIRYPDTETCVCPRCRRLFEENIGRKVADWPNALETDEDLKEAWRKFRCGVITSYVKGVVEAVRRDCPGVGFSAAVRPSSRLGTYWVAQDWESWAKEGWFDFVCTMNYTSSPKRLKESSIATIKKENCPVKVYPALGPVLWNFKDGRDLERLRDQVLAVREAGFDGFSIFEWSHRCEKFLPVLTPQTRQLKQRAIGR